MTDYNSLAAKPKQFQALTAYTLEEFDALLPTFTERFQAQMQAYTLGNKPRQRRRYVSYRNSPLPTMADKLLFILMYLRKATTQNVLFVILSSVETRLGAGRRWGSPSAF
jgi:hypothetical protein